MKILKNPHLALTVELQKFFEEQKSKWAGEFPSKINCRIESDRDTIDKILFRRHTGTQSGVGQSAWDDRMKDTFVQRTGKGGKLNVADEIEAWLSESSLLPGRRPIPRSTLNRLLSSEIFRNRVGISAKRGRLRFTHEKPTVLNVLFRIAKDLSNRKIVLGDLWDTEGKQKYLDRLEGEGILPTAAQALSSPSVKKMKGKRHSGAGSTASKPVKRSTLIPHLDFGIAWPGRIQRIKSIWEELQYKLDLSEQPNVISILFRVLLELSVDNYILQSNMSNINSGDKLVQKAIKVAEDLESKGKIDRKYLGIIKKLPQLDGLFSIDKLNRYIHSPNFAPSPEHLTALWDTVSDFVVQCVLA